MVCEQKNKIWTFMSKAQIKRKIDPNYNGKTYRFLSNFYINSDKSDLCKIEKYNYMSVEHYYQAMKFNDPKIRKQIREAFSPFLAKKIAHKNEALIRKDWDNIKLDIMEKGVRAKFMQNEYLKKKLLQTGNVCLEEGNTWNDLFWGKSLKTGKGQNHLGKILMKVRQEIKNTFVF